LTKQTYANSFYPKKPNTKHMRKRLPMVLLILLLATAYYPFANASSGFPSPYEIKDKPIISIASPSSNVTNILGNGQFIISFSVTMPDSWTSTFGSGTNFIGAITSVTCTLDQTQILYDNTTNGYPNDPTANPVHYLKVLNSLSLGQHSLTISVQAFTVYMLDLNPVMMQKYDASTSETYTFAVGPSSSPTPQVQTNIPTSVSITQISSSAFLDYPVHFRIQINPLPPTSNDRFTNYTFTAMAPDNTTLSLNEDANNSTISFPVDGNVIDGYLNFTGLVGGYTLKVDFLGQTFANGTYYMPSENETSFNIVAHTEPLPNSPSPSPSVQEFPTWTTLPAILVASIVVAVAVKRKKR
jgi:hypothetical protein